ncbi:MAG: hypothetical protein RLO52_07855 [Sandaracinaceae bacterium]
MASLAVAAGVATGCEARLAEGRFLRALGRFFSPAAVVEAFSGLDFLALVFFDDFFALLFFAPVFSDDFLALVFFVDFFALVFFDDFFALDFFDDFFALDFSVVESSVAGFVDDLRAEGRFLGFGFVEASSGAALRAASPERADDDAGSGGSSAFAARAGFESSGRRSRSAVDSD